MFNRYNTYNVLVNNSQEYKPILDRKKINILRQYPTFSFNNLKNLKDYGISSTIHKVEPFDRLYLISQDYYNSPEYGWIILYTNGIKSELELSIGTYLNIYYPIDSLLGLL